MGRAIEMSGRRFGRLVVVERVGRMKNGNITWRCKCDCGGECVVDGHLLRTGCTISCGCARREQSRAAIRNNPATRKHIGDWRMLEKTWHPKSDELRSNNKSGVTGVNFDQQQQRWIARLFFNGKYVLNQAFVHQEMAVEARKEAELQYLD